MRAYFAVIKDSFREALASRVLWILLVLIGLFLAALTPLAVEEELASTLLRTDIRTGAKFTRTLLEQSQSPEMTPGKHIWPMLSGELQQSIIESLSGSEDEQDRRSVRVVQQVIGELNDLLGRRDFYDETAWSKVRLKEEARRLLEKGLGDLPEEELRRFNRLALDAAYPKDVLAAAKSSTRVEYFGFSIGEALPFDRTQVNQAIKTILATAMSFLVGTLGVFVAILVTASIIPQMFEAGAIDLLLSKPISRSLLFLTKFLGGCAFILLNSTFLIVGVWMIVGWRFDIWSSKLLLCIPVFLFLFAIYYAVSAFSGVVWKNAVISVVMAIVFWAVCFVVGTTRNVIETFFLNPKRIATIVPAGDGLMAVDAAGATLEWMPGEREWSPKFASSRKAPNQPPLAPSFSMLGPVYDPAGDRLVAVESTSPSFGGFGGTGRLVSGKRSDDWKRVSGVSVPNGTKSMFLDREGRILVAGTSGVFRFEGDPAVEHVPFKVLGLDVAANAKAGRFVEIGPNESDNWINPFAADLNPRDESLAVVSHGKLQRLEQNNEGRYALAREADLASDSPALVASAGDTTLVAFGTGEIGVFDASTLERKETFRPFGAEKPRQMAALANGKLFAVLTHNRNLWLYDAENRRPSRLGFSGQGHVSAVATSTTGKLLVADRFGRVIEYDPETGNVSRRFEPKPEVLEMVYRYAVNPLYTVFPKPGELDNLVQYLLTEQKTAAMGGEEDDLRAQRVAFNVWQPVWSNLAFLAVVLCIACIYIERKDF